ncbi:rRNA accumulation- protein [Ophidiomyces ophidiicola]|uniref:rRNA accumulation- protein n=1 Tax=Ophidiomyces ophidiicola TaxID=1387563 RepID=A0ACB8V3H5_9EURO|nr:rRNA accumulation- protein [Ophidiomyces ophidiicola]KAI1954680.1 rRNA accumulation- protein [Ophidiomyces ophidiicola]KAI1958508.1 rRNA accumulation- protein [Ophidiomyces ophidiicola]KAI2007580.1 rRNA accumulation- protein [Ophidiomyces ophidiicola]KAI2017976.1 rRNA accumulation- protein [Ophidiomyces ophidiicola]
MNEAHPQFDPPQAPAKPLSPSAQLDLAITLILNCWPVLNLAVQSSWGGPNSSEKRDWLCAAVAELFSSRPDTDSIDLEEVLLQVMNDEFDVVVDDESGADIADRIMEVKAEIEKGELARVNKLWEEYNERERRGGDNLSLFKGVDVKDEDQETDGDEDEEESDVEMADAPTSKPPKERELPEVDEDGFTKVVGRRKR